MTAEEELKKIKAQRAAAHKKWRHSDKGKAYRQREKEKRILERSTVVKLCRGCTDETCKKSGCIAA